MGRNADIRMAMKAQRERREVAKTKKRNRKIRQRPWIVLMGEWHEEMKSAFGKEFVSSPWGEAEKALARKLVAEVGFDDALDMTRRLLRNWGSKGRKGTPGFKLLWSMRDTLRAEIRGQLKTKKERVNRDEFNAERADTCPDIGW